MAFRVEIAPRAFRDLDGLATELKERSQSYHVGRKWFLSILDAIDSLSEMPERRPSVTDADDEIERVRLLLHGNRNRLYKIYYCVRRSGPSTGTVSVFHVRHWARQVPGEDELRELMDESLEEEGNGGES